MAAPYFRRPPLYAQLVHTDRWPTGADERSELLDVYTREPATAIYVFEREARRLEGEAAKERTGGRADRAAVLQQDAVLMRERAGVYRALADEQRSRAHVGSGAAVHALHARQGAYKDALFNGSTRDLLLVKAADLAARGELDAAQRIEAEVRAGR